MDKDTIIQSAVQASTATVKWGGALGATIGWLSFNEWLALAGFIVAIFGTIINSRVNFYYRQKEFGLKILEDKRAQERHDALRADWKPLV